MKSLLLVLSSFMLLLATTPEEREANLQSVVDMQISHTVAIEKRINRIHTELERKAQERLDKEKRREEKRNKLNEQLKAKAIAREKISN